ncbi:hypothetical protein D3C80_1408570 [compost metagenome]
MTSEATRQATTKFYRRSPTKLGDFQAALPATNYMVVLGKTDSYTEPGYYDKDPSTTGYIHSLKVVMLESEAEVSEWVKMHLETDGKTPYQIIKVAPVSITTTVSVNLG